MLKIGCIKNVWYIHISVSKNCKTSMVKQLFWVKSGTIQISRYSAGKMCLRKITEVALKRVYWNILNVDIIGKLSEISYHYKKKFKTNQELKYGAICKNNYHPINFCITSELFRQTKTNVIKGNKLKDIHTNNIPYTYCL